MKIGNFEQKDLVVSVSEMDLVAYNSKHRDSNLRECQGFNITINPEGKVVDIQFRNGQKKKTFDGVHLENVINEAKSYAQKQLNNKQAIYTHKRYLKKTGNYAT